MQREIIALRQESSRAKRLEQDYENLRALLTHAEGVPRTLKNDYGKLAEAHGILKDAHREALNINQQWTVFYSQHLWKSKNSRSAASPDADVSEPNDDVQETKPAMLQITYPTDVQETKPAIRQPAYPMSSVPDSMSSSAANANPKVLPQNGSASSGEIRSHQSSLHSPTPSRSSSAAPEMTDLTVLPQNESGNSGESSRGTPPSRGSSAAQDTADLNVLPPNESTNLGGSSRSSPLTSRGTPPITKDSSVAQYDMPPLSEEDDMPSRSEEDDAETCEDLRGPVFPMTGPRVDPATRYVEPHLVSLDDDSDSPVFLSERVLKRKRGSIPKRNNPEGQHVSAGFDGVQEPIHIKSDLGSSPMTSVSYLALTGPQDSVDLDDVGEKHFTPRKRRRLASEMWHRQEGTGYGNSMQYYDSEDQSAKTSQNMIDIQPGILRPKDSNVPPLPRTSQHLMNRRRTLPPSRRDQVSDRFHFLAEDGEDFGGAGSSNKAIRDKQTDFENETYKASKAPDSDRRLGALLGSAVRTRGLVSNNHTANLANPVTETAMQPMQPNPARRRIYGNDPKPSLNRIARTSELGSSRVGKHTRPNSRNRTAVRPTSGLSRTEEPDKVLPKHEPLRIRPVSTLFPSDFKVNPSHNRGYDHPFSEVVRNRDLRKCMPGCTRPGCCGSTLRKAVEIGGFAAPRTSGLLNSFPSNDWEADQRFLEAYLGDSSYCLDGMPDQQRNELLLEAKTSAFANSHGKHRHEYARAPSPPGFWEPDMPTTQQEKENRAAAMVLEKEKVAERYREAMRADGRYKFRDE